MTITKETKYKTNSSAIFDNNKNIVGGARLHIIALYSRH